MLTYYVDGPYEPNGDSRTAIYYCWKCIIIHILHITSLNFCKFEMHNHLSFSYLYKLTRLFSLKILSFISILFQLFTNYSKKNQLEEILQKSYVIWTFLNNRLISKGNFPKKQQTKFLSILKVVESKIFWYFIPAIRGYLT